MSHINFPSYCTKILIKNEKQLIRIQLKNVNVFTLTMIIYNILYRGGYVIFHTPQKGDENFEKVRELLSCPVCIQKRHKYL